MASMVGKIPAGIAVILEALPPEIQTQVAAVQAESSAEVFPTDPSR